MSNLRAAIAAREDTNVDDIALTITANLTENSSRFSDVHIRVTAESDLNELRKLVTIAERACIAANTLRGAVDLTFEVG